MNNMFYGKQEVIRVKIRAMSKVYLHEIGVFIFFLSFNDIRGKKIRNKKNKYRLQESDKGAAGVCR